MALIGDAEAEAGAAEVMVAAVVAEASDTAAGEMAVEPVSDDDSEADEAASTIDSPDD